MQLNYPSDFEAPTNRPYRATNNEIQELIDAALECGKENVVHSTMNVAVFCLHGKVYVATDYVVASV